jgi:hypothetical protein
MYNILILYYSRCNLDQVKEEEMGRAYNMHGRRGMHIGIRWGSQKKRDY